MRVKTALLKKTLALLLALILIFPSAGFTVFATGEGQPVTVTDGDLVADNYDCLTDGEKNILKSGLVRGNTYTYHAPDESDGIVTIDADNKTVTAKTVTKDGFAWYPVSAVLKYNGGEEIVKPTFNGSADAYEGNFEYEGNVYNVDVEYAMSIATASDLQAVLLNGPYYFVRGLEDVYILDDNYFYFDSLSSNQNTLDSLIDGSLPLGVRLTTQETIDAINSLADQVDKNDGCYDILVMLDEYEESESPAQYLFEHGAELKAKAVETYGYIYTIYVDEGITSLINLMGTSSSTGRNLVRAKNTLKNVLEGTEEAVNDDWAILESSNNPFKSGLTSNDYKTLDSLAEDAEDAEYHDDDIKNELYVESVTVSSDINQHNVTVSVTAEIIADDSTDSVVTVSLESHSVTLQIKDGASPDAVLAAIAESGIEAQALEAWKSVNSENFTRTATELTTPLTEDISYTVAYSPKQYGVTYGFTTDLPAFVPYGYNMTLPRHDGDELVYDYYTADGTRYLQGSVIRITENTNLTRTEGKPWTVLNKAQIIAEVYADDLTDAEEEILRSSAIVSDEVLIRKPANDDGIVTVSVNGNSIEITANDYPSGLSNLKWIPAKGNAISGNGEVASEFGFSDNKAVVSGDDVIGITVIYELAINDTVISDAELLSALNLPKTLVEEAKEQKSNLEALNEHYEELGQFDRTTLNQIRIGVNGSDMTEGARTAVVTILDNCVNPLTERLYLYEYLTEYRAAGMTYYYQNGNSEKFSYQVKVLNENLSTIYNDEGFFPLLDDSGKAEYYDDIGQIIASLSSVKLSAPDAAVNTGSAALSDLLASVNGMSDNTHTFDTADRDLILETALTVAAPEKSVMTVTVSVQNSGGVTVNTKTGTVIFSSSTPLTQNDVANIQNKVNGLVNDLGVDTAHYATSDTLQITVGETVADDTTVTFTYTPNRYTSAIKNENEETVGTESFWFDNAKITLPACTAEDQQYRYTVCGNQITVASEPKTYTFMAEQIDSGAYAVITRETVDVYRISATDSEGKNVYSGDVLSLALTAAGDGGLVEIFGEVVLNKNYELSCSVALIGADKITFGENKIIISDTKVQLVSSNVSIKDNVDCKNEDYIIKETVSGENYVYSLMLIKYKIVFMVDGEVYDTVEYTYGAETVNVPDVPQKTGYDGVWESFTLNSAEQITVNAVYTEIIPETKITVTAANGSVLYTGDDINAAFDAAQAGGTIAVTGQVAVTEDVSLKKAVTVTGGAYIGFGNYFMILADKNAALNIDVQIKNKIKSGSEYSTVSETGQYTYKLKALAPKVTSVTVKSGNKSILGYTLDKNNGVLILDILDPESKTNKTHAGNGITADELIKSIGCSTENAAQTKVSISNDGVKLSGTALVPTGSKIAITASNTDSASTATATYTVIILGDVNKNGRVDSGDAKLMFDHYMGSKNLTGYVFMAADVNRNGRVDSGDAVKNTVKYSKAANYATALK